MRCLLGCLSLLTPRVLILLLWLFTDYLTAAYDTVIWPLLGFFFLPITTLGYAVAQNEFLGTELLWWVTVVAAVGLDMGLMGSGSWGVRGGKRKRRRR